MKELEIREFSAESNLLEAVYKQMECDFPERAVSEVLVFQEFINYENRLVNVPKGKEN